MNDGGELTGCIDRKNGLRRRGEGGHGLNPYTPSQVVAVADLCGGINIDNISRRSDQDVSHHNRLKPRIRVQAIYFTALDNPRPALRRYTIAR